MNFQTYFSVGVLAGLLLTGLPGDVRAQDVPQNSLYVETLDLSKMTVGYGTPNVGKSIDGHPLTLGGVVYPHGIGTHAESVFVIDLHGSATRFSAMVGVDDEVKTNGSVAFSIIVDGKKAAQTGVLHGGDAPKPLSVDLTGAQRLTLEVTDGGDGITYDHADWAGAVLTLVPGAAVKPEAFSLPVELPRLVVPAPDPHPAIHGPRIIGETPGRPFLFLIPATGDGPLTYSAKLLPAGLELDTQTGIISGALAKAGTTDVMLSVRGPRGTVQRTLTIVGGAHKLALTPPLGWNSWNVWADRVDEGKVKDAADEMIAAGLARHGFQYINIDDTWEADRDAQGVIQTNAKFPDMAALAAYIHSKGLKVGIYSSPGPKTCGGYTASYQHEAQDAATYAKWGMDYLKYDWCSYDEVVHGDHSLPVLQKPYDVMGTALAAQPRDIVFSLCQYGDGDVWKWGASTGGNCWRTTGDIEDNWGSLHGIYESQAGHEVYAGPGHWNDPDMLMVGIVGKGNVHPTHLTPNEQVLHISMWCLLSSPLLIGCDMTKLDPLTLTLLTNDEALDINQDPLGKPAGRIFSDGSGGEVWARPLFDGTHAVGLINADIAPRVITVHWSTLGLTGPQPVRDLWLHKNVGTPSGSYSVAVPAHGAVLLKIGTPNRGSE
ncbi:MAG: NPCBM/NEW2 domain-containing protein [Janthinobacterium lividum]